MAVSEDDADAAGLVASSRASARAAERSHRAAAIAFLDVVGFTHHLQADEASTLAVWNDMRLRLIEPMVNTHGGRVVEVLGDGLLLDFPIASAAVRWALEVQARLVPSAKAAGRRGMFVRIALHHDQVLIDGDRIRGEGVTVAARLQEHADPGGIVMSAALYELVRAELHCEVADLGPLALKNFDGRVRAFAVPGVSPAEARSPAALPSHRPAVAVLPLRALGPDPMEDYFIEGLLHEIVGALATFRELFVISSSSTVRLGSGVATAEDIGRRLGVGYVVSGSVLRRGEHLRFTTELVDAERGILVWQDRYDTRTSDLLAAQDAAATRIAHSLLPHLRQSELRRIMRIPPPRMDAYDLAMQAMHRLYRLTPEDFRASRELLEQAIARDPRYSLAHALLAHHYTLLMGEGVSKEPERDSRLAMHHAVLALESDPLDPLASAIYGHNLAFLEKRLDDAVAAFDRAISASPNSAIAWGMSSPTYAYRGEGATAVARGEYALRLSPLDPYAHLFHAFLGLAHYVNGTYEEAIRWSRRSVATNPRFVAALRHLIASLSADERVAEAKIYAAQLKALLPDFRVRAFLAAYPIREPERIEAYAVQLLKAGLPE